MGNAEARCPQEQDRGSATSSSGNTTNSSGSTSNSSDSDNNNSISSNSGNRGDGSCPLSLSTVCNLMSWGGTGVVVPSLVGKRAFVASPSPGIGFLITQELTRAGAEVAVMIRYENDPELAERGLALLKQYVPGAQVALLHGSPTSLEDIESVTATYLESELPLDILVTTATAIEKTSEISGSQSRSLASAATSRKRTKSSSSSLSPSTDHSHSSSGSGSKHRHHPHHDSSKHEGRSTVPAPGTPGSRGTAASSTCDNNPLNVPFSWNALAPFVTTGRLMPALLKTKRPRVVVISNTFTLCLANNKSNGYGNLDHSLNGNVGTSNGLSTRSSSSSNSGMTIRGAASSNNSGARMVRRRVQFRIPGDSDADDSNINGVGAVRDGQQQPTDPTSTSSSGGNKTTTNGSVSASSSDEQQEDDTTVFDVMFTLELARRYPEVTAVVAYNDVSYTDIVKDIEPFLPKEALIDDALRHHVVEASHSSSSTSGGSTATTPATTATGFAASIERAAMIIVRAATERGTLTATQYQLPSPPSQGTASKTTIGGFSGSLNGTESSSLSASLTTAAPLKSTKSERRRIAYWDSSVARTGTVF